MKKIVVILASFALLLAVGAPVQAAFSKAAGTGGTPPSAPTGAPIVLYSQLDNPAGNGAPDQDFEAAFDAYDSESADDFVVTAPGWTIESLTTVGTLSPGGSGAGATVDITFYTNSAGGGDPDLPGTAIAACTYPAVVPVSAAGSYTITLPTPCILAPGTYWLALQTNQSFTTSGQHFWSNRITQTNSEGVFRNPNGGFATGCATFTPQTVCGVGGGLSPDFLFSLLGALGGLDADLSITKTGAVAGTQITYTLSVTNNDPTNGATAVVVTDALPPEVAYVSNTCGGNNVPPFTWNIGNLAAGATVTCDIVVNVVTPGTIVNTASVTSASDPNGANDSSTTTLVTGVSPPGIPTLSSVGMAALLVLLAVAAMVAIRRLKV